MESLKNVKNEISLWNVSCYLPQLLDNKKVSFSADCKSARLKYKIVEIMKKRRKNDDDSCLGQFVKTILLLACICWGVKTAMRTVVDNKWWLIGGIAVVSYLLVKLFKDDDYVSMHTCTLAIVLGAIIFTTNFYIPISTQQRQAVIQDLYGSGGKMRTTQCVLRFTDNGQKVNVSGGFNKEDYHVGDTVTVTNQHGCLGMDVVRYVK